MKEQGTMNKEQGPSPSQHPGNNCVPDPSDLHRCRTDIPQDLHQEALRVQVLQFLQICGHPEEFELASRLCQCVDCHRHVAISRCRHCIISSRNPSP